MTGFLRAMRGWLTACATATGFIFIASHFIAAMATGNFRSVVFAGSIWGLLIPSLLIFAITCLLTAIPAALVIWLGRKFQMRSIWYFGGAGAVIGILSQIAFFAGLLSRAPGKNPLYLLAGLIAGTVYWRIVERRPALIEAHTVPVPSDSVLAPLYVGADLLDAYAIHLPAGASDDPEVLARVAFERQAAWIRALTWVRDTVMAMVGVKSSRAIGAAAAARGLPVIGFFPVQSKCAGEMVMGEDDRHLDFRVAVLVRADTQGGRELVVMTVVHCHNRLGRTYLALIAPFHRTIVRATLQRTARMLEG